MNTAEKLHHTPMHIVGRKNYINLLAQNEPRTGVLFTDFIAETAERKEKRNGKSYKKNYNTLIKHIENFSKTEEAIIYTNSVNELFIDDFIVYLEEQNLRRSYIKQLIDMVKSMAKRAGMFGYAIDRTYDNVDFDAEESESVYLTEMEIARIYYFIGLTPKQQRIRDLFIMGCLTGLRYSDYSVLDKNNFQGDFIVKITKKTRKKVVIPIHDLVREIYNRYDGCVGNGLSIQHFNRYIKEICRKIGIDTEVQRHFTKGGKIITETKPKYEFISSHTARRSFATNMYLTGRLQAFEIMSITGHTTEKSFFRYIKVKQEDTVKQIAGDRFFKI